MTLTSQGAPVKKVLVIGASGLTGKELVKTLINDRDIKEIHLILRRKASITSKKVLQHIIDFNNIEIFNYLFKCDVVFCCLGTTLRIAKTKANFKAVDVELVTKCAELSVAENCKKLIIISALGANSRSMFFYNKCKGEMQNNVIAVCAETLTQVIFCQPSLLLGARDEKRVAEGFSAKLSQWFNFIWHGVMKKYQPITAIQLATAMHTLATTESQESVTIVNNRTLHQLSSKH